MSDPVQLALVGEVSPELFGLLGQLGAAGATVHLGAGANFSGPIVVPVPKDPDQALAAFRKVRATHASLPLVVLGDLDVRTALALMRAGGVQVVLPEEGGAGVLGAVGRLMATGPLVASGLPAASPAPARAAAPAPPVSPLVKAVGPAPAVVRGSAQSASAPKADFPAVGDTIARIERLRAQPNVGVADVEKAIIHDPALVAAVIRASNSAQYRSPRMVTNVRDAVVRMGMQQVFSVMVASTVVRGLQLASPRGHGLLQQLWKTAMLTGELGRCIAESEQLPRPEELYLAALLHNLGEMVLVWRHFQQGGDESPQAMRELGLLVAREHEAVGRATASAWGLPPIVQNMAGYHHDVRPSEPASDVVARHLVLAAGGLAREVMGDVLEAQVEVDGNAALDQLGASATTRARLARACASVFAGSE